MIIPRVIPTLLLKGKGLYKTTQFRNPKYIGDPINAVKIFNEKEVDELVLLDIDASVNSKKPDFSFIEEIVSEAFMPVAYGGGIKTVHDVEEILKCGIEKVVLSSAVIENSSFMKILSENFGSSTIVACLDVKKNYFGKYSVQKFNGRINTKINPIDLSLDLENAGAGELFINSIDNDGTMAGYDLELLKNICSKTTIPVVALGGAGKLDDFHKAIIFGGASAVAAGSLFVYHGKYRAVLINYPNQEKIKNLFSER